MLRLPASKPVEISKAWNHADAHPPGGKHVHSGGAGIRGDVRPRQFRHAQSSGYYGRRAGRAASPLSSAELPTARGVHHLEAFLEMMSAERGAAANTLAAYRRDLLDYLSFMTARG